MDLSLLIAMLLVKTPSAVVLLVFIVVWGCLCPIYLWAWHSGMALHKFMNRATSSSSAADDMTDLMILAMVMMAPLFRGSVESFEVKNCLLLCFLIFIWRGKRHIFGQRVTCHLYAMKQLRR